MAISWGEKPNSRETSTHPGSATLHYILTGTNSETTARFLAAGYSAAMYAALYRTNITLKEIGPLMWDVAVSYGPKQKKEPEPGDFSWSFDTGGGSKHVTHALAHIQSYVPAGDTAADHKGAIGVNENGDVEGVDVVDASFKWKENHKLLLADNGWEFSETLEDLTGTVNDATFRGKAAGTVLFEGGSGGQSQKDPLILDVTFSFAYSRSATGLTIGDITGVAKTGWHYLWTEYATTDGGAAKRPAKKAKQVNVERVYEEGDFSLLGIGTDPL